MKEMKIKPLYILIGVVLCLLLSGVVIIFSPNGLNKAEIFTDKGKVKELKKEAYAACSKQDFEKAHECLNEILSLGYKSSYEECRDNIIREECAFLVAQDNEQSAKRIVFLLLQSYDDSYDRSEMKDNVLKLAKSVNNQYVIAVLEKMGEK